MPALKKAAAAPKAVSKPKAAKATPAKIKPRELPPIDTIGEIRIVPYAALYIAPENARFGVSEVENLDEITATIERHGLLQPPIAYEGDRHEEGGQSYAITNGRRRHAAIGAVIAAHPERFAEGVPVRVVPRAYAVEIALAGELHVSLKPAQEARAWLRMNLEGATAETIAKAFGTTEHRVLQRLKLGSLHEPILIALDAEQITLDVAHAYAGASMSRQETVWKALGANAAAPRVRSALNENTITAGSALARFITEPVYSEAGGRIEQELFARPEDSRWLDVETAQQLATSKLDAIAKSISEQEPGWQFIDRRFERFALGLYGEELVDGNLGATRKPNPEEKAERTKLEQRLRQIEKRQDAIRKEHANIPEGDEGDELYNKLEDEEDALRQESDALELRRDALVQSLHVFDEAARAKSGVLLSIDTDGSLQITRGLVRAKDQPRGRAKAKPAKKGKGASASPATPEPQADMTHTTHERTTRIAAKVIAASLQHKPEIALAVLGAQLARIVIYSASARMDEGGEKHGRDLLLLQRRHQSHDPNLPALASDKDTERDAAHWRVALQKAWSKLEETIAAWDQEEQIKLIAYCTGQLFTVLETQPTDTTGGTRKRAAAIGKLAGADPGALFSPTLEYLKGLSTPALHAAAGELGLEVSANGSKAALAAALADAARPQAWTPPLLRELTGAEWKRDAAAKPKSGPAPVKKPAKKAKAVRTARAAPRKPAAKKAKKKGGKA